MRVVKATSLETVVSTTHKLKKPIGLTRDICCSRFKKVARPEWHSDSHSAPVLPPTNLTQPQVGSEASLSAKNAVM